VGTNTVVDVVLVVAMGGSVAPSVAGSPHDAAKSDDVAVSTATETMRARPMRRSYAGYGADVPAP
jgi:hypothetical protein